MALLLGMAGGCDLNGPNALPATETFPNEPIAKTVNVMRATLSQGIYERAISYGRMQPRRKSALGFARGGRVAEVTSELGDRVAAGERLAALDQRNMEAQLQKLEDALADARTQNAILEQGVRTTAIERQMETLQLEIDSLESQKADLTVELELGQIIAPYDGTIAECNINLGDAAAAGQPVIQILEEAPPTVALDVPQTVAEQIDVGDQVEIRLDGQAISAAVMALAPVLNRSSRTQTVKLDVATIPPDTRWTYGDIVEVHFWLPTDRSGFWLPISALHREVDSLWAAYVVEGDADRQIIARRILELLQLEDEHVLVSGALREGELVVADGSNRIVPGERVQTRQTEFEFRQPGPIGRGE